MRMRSSPTADGIAIGVNRSARACRRALGATPPLFRSKEHNLDSHSDALGAS